VWRQPGLDLSMGSALAAHFRRHGTRIVHAHQCSAWFYAALSRLRHARPRLLLEEHGRFHPEVHRPLRRLFNRWVTRPLTHRCVAVSADIRSRLVTYEGLRAGDIEVIHNGVPAPVLLQPAERCARRAALGLPPEAFVVGTVGRFDPIKNLPMLVRALELAGANLPTLHAVLVGEGPLLGAIGDQLRAGPMADRVRLTGYQADARELSGCFDLFVLASHSEGISIALLDAQAAGVPAAVTRVGGNPDVVLDGQTGWVVAPDDARGMAAAIVAAAREPLEAAGRGEAARRRHREHFDSGAMIGSYRRLYREMLQGAT
jgi:glycosyltransferase involved in cell wall biosynthesis